MHKSTRSRRMYPDIDNLTEESMDNNEYWDRLIELSLNEKKIGNELDISDKFTNTILSWMQSFDREIYLAPNHTINLLYAVWIVVVCILFTFFILVFPVTIQNSSPKHHYSKCNFNGQYYSIEEFTRNFSVLASKKDVNYSSNTSFGVFNLIKSYLKKIHASKSSQPFIISILSGSNPQNFSYIQSVNLLKTFSKFYSVLNGNEYKNENDRYLFETLIMDSLLTLPSRPIIIRNISQLHPFVAKSFFKFFDGVESYCRSAFFILLINDEESISHVPTNLVECENAAVTLLTQRWNESIPSYTLQPLITRITQFTIFI